MLHTTSTVSWIALAFVGLREAAESASWAKATDRAETCEFLEDKLHEVEAQLKELREESFWIFQLWCSGTFSLLLLALLIVALVATCWCCVRSCIRRANVVVDIGGSQKRGVAPAVRAGGWCDESDSLGEEVCHEWLSLWPCGRTSERERAPSFLVGTGRSVE